MPDPRPFDPDAVRDAWDHAADAYAAGQADGRDYYRLEFFGPAQAALVGDVAGRRLLDVGCGSGWFAREMARRGAAVTGVDLSPRMIELARAEEARHPLGIAYEACDAAAVAERFPTGAFDVATSCVALQDMTAPDAALRAVHAVLRPGGRFVAAITHPFTDAPSRDWRREPDGRKRDLCVDRYFDEVPVWFTWRRWAYEFTTPTLHVPLERWVEWILAAGFRLRALREPRPDAETVRREPRLADARRVPYYVMFDLERE